MTQVYYIVFSCLLLPTMLGAQEILQEEPCSNSMTALAYRALHPKSLQDVAEHLAYLRNVSSSDACSEACCKTQDCHLTFAETSAKGLLDCFLVNCIIDGENKCRFVSITGSGVIVKSNTVPSFVLNNVEDADPSSSPLEMTSDDFADLCQAPPEVGLCRASMPRFYYNGSTNSCQLFIYGGCGGNKNNYATAEQCMSTCTVTVIPKPAKLQSPDKRELCQAPPEVGLCRASMPRFYYTSSTNSCQLFIYGGCGGNKNNYATAEQCMSTCTVNVVPSPTNEQACSGSYETGPCRGAFQNFYFDASSGSCLPFIYGGCKGNNNRYNSVEECMSTCVGGHISEHKHRRNTPAFLLVATLAAMSALLLGGFILLLVQRARSRSRHLRDDKEELLPGEQLAEHDKPKPVST